MKVIWISSGILAIVLVMTVMLACKKLQKPMPGAPAAMTQSEPQPENENIVQDFIPTDNQYNTIAQCPVSGDHMAVSDKTPAVRYKGRSMFFCCGVCAKEFKANPDKYMK